jgi:hypothetical protein
MYCDTQSCESFHPRSMDTKNKEKGPKIPVTSDLRLDLQICFQGI